MDISLRVSSFEPIHAPSARWFRPHFQNFRNEACRNGLILRITKESAILKLAKIESLRTVTK